MARYDEDLHENPFFNTLVTKYNIMFSEAAEKKLMVSQFGIAAVPHTRIPPFSDEGERGRGHM